MDKSIYVYFKWNGRIPRMTYWLFSLPFILIAVLFEFYPIKDTYLTVFYLVTMYPLMMINIKRAHDRNRSGFFVLLLFVPILGLWPAIEFGFFPGTEGENDFGMEVAEDITSR